MDKTKPLIYRGTTIERSRVSGMYQARPLIGNCFTLLRADTLRGIKVMIDEAFRKQK